ncbi:pentapeptide repeat-containing protein [Rhodococcus sp. (in: high G+C Gram-positive bacteria)]|uniref:pentapeptide repeat-containing protein n=1 Tax=Rhodococcus sp. TaxID=1831 RepID=UPI00257EDA59|nr:pentapeptide repeat-containing protein [Rhodococcus sp. (in: high G+C Gram-positive bacteria)]
MTRTEHQYPPRRTTRAPITAVLGGVVLAASVMFGTAVGPAAAVETSEQIITRVCGNYVFGPTSTVSTNCFGKDLSGANLTDANLTGANLTGANLTDANLTDAWMTDANLTGTSAIRPTLRPYPPHPPLAPPSPGPTPPCPPD